MIKATVPIQLGKTKIAIQVEGETQMDVIRQIACWQQFPEVGPGGENDLRFSYRQVDGDYEYYSIVSRDAGQEFQLGQCKKPKGELFPKSWVVPQRDLNRQQEDVGSDDRFASVDELSDLFRKMNYKTQADVKDFIHSVVNKSVLPADLTSAQRGQVYGELKQASAKK